MSGFSLSRIDNFRNNQRKAEKDIIDLKFPSELTDEDEISTKQEEVAEKELLAFIVDDDPFFLQILNTHFSKQTLHFNDCTYTFKIRNFATGKSCINELGLNPDLILLNFFINKGLPNALSGRDTMDKILDINPNQKIIILNDLEEKLRGAFVENGLRDYIIKDEAGLTELNNTITDILS